MKWYTYTEYVDQQTGEVLTKREAKLKYIIIKKIKKHERKQQWEQLPTGTKIRTEHGITTITNICTRNGWQRSIWETN